MAAIKKCSEFERCGNYLLYEEDHPKAGQPKPPGTKTCTPVCRARRQRRLDRQRREGGQTSPYAPEHQDLAKAAAGKLPDVVHEVAKEELRPLIRDAMTEEVLRSIDTLVGLTPAAIEKLQEHIASEDETISQRAVTLLLKYTMGNPSVAPPPKEQAQSGLNIVFNVPRPEDTTGPESSGHVDLRECTDCGGHKEIAEFVGGSNRCTQCFEEIRDRAVKTLGD